ncbi:MAG TPA: glycosyl transferase family 28 [Bacteroidales bacterium]|nr:glycosyl transferase family 28 [Bacteroidales bacterium]
MRKTALVCPLDWGLGHAARCIPVIKNLLHRNFRVVVAADGLPLRFLKDELGDLVEYRVLAGKTIRYHAKGFLLLALARQIPSFMFSIWAEQRRLEQLIEETGACLVVSDNRYGLISKKATNVIITHQLFVKLPVGFRWAEPLVWAAMGALIKRFDRCWIPDNPDHPSLSGELSHGKTLPAHWRFIGTLSRFGGNIANNLENPLPENFPTAFYLALLSGPEPQRSLLEELLERQFAALNLPVVLATGKPGSSSGCSFDGVFKVSHFKTHQLAWLIQNCTLVVCRSGYSTLMDLAVFGKKALLIPTPGQTEQEYLGKQMTITGQALSVDQSQLSLEDHLRLAEQFSGISKISHNHLLSQALDEVEAMV